MVYFPIILLMFFNPVFLMLVGLALLALLVCIGLVIFASFPVWLPALVLSGGGGCVCLGVGANVSGADGRGFRCQKW
jgi:hypothetical protein